MSWLLAKEISLFASMGISCNLCGVRSNPWRDSFGVINVGRFSEAFSDQLRRLNNNAQAALYHVFEQQLSDRGLVSAPEFFLPPNEFDIVGGVADERRGEYVLIEALDATEGTMLDWDHIEQANKKASKFLEGCNAYSPYPENNSTYCMMHSFEYLTQLTSWTTLCSFY